MGYSMRRLAATAMVDMAEGRLLKSCDVLLLHSKRNPRAWLIQRGTHSYWNHALMIHVVDEAALERQRVLIIDPKMSGLKIDEVGYYLQSPDRYDVGVKRFEQEWFQNDPGTAGMCCRARVLELALRKVNDSLPRSGQTWRAVTRFLRHFKLAFHLKQQMEPRGQQSSNTRGNEPLDVTAYTCSGFIQWCYYHAVAQALQNNSLIKDRIRETIFNPRLSMEADDYGLLSTTPADLARSDKLVWKYLVKNGVVWEVSNEEEINSITGSGKTPK
jgi:hypothetical protein